MMPMTAAAAELPLDVRGPQQLRCDHLGSQSRRVALENAERAVEKFGARGIGAGTWVERCILNDCRENMLTGGSQCLVVHARNRDLQSRLARTVAVFRLIERRLDVVSVGRDDQ